jgi:hypothetical protein
MLDLPLHLPLVANHLISGPLPIFQKNDFRALPCPEELRIGRDGVPRKRDEIQGETEA